MDTSKLKRYAVQARKDFRAGISARAKRIGVSSTGIESYSVRGDLLIIGEQTFPKDYKQAFDSLYREVDARGFDVLVDEIAYTWFNRFVALRYMELHDYFPHGQRILSSKDQDPTPQVLRDPLSLRFSYGFNAQLAKELYEAGNKEEELYRMVLIAQCNELNTIMPFLFEKVSDLSELLLPDNLLASDSIVRTLVNEIEEEAWFEGVEIIGWIYQYYISEKKDEVIGKVVKSEDIPAATQLFTPNWIVKYLVQNSVGAYWLSIYPDSPLASKMEYYIKPADQEPEVKEALQKITPVEINPEDITVLDPACGSGHILVEAYDLLKEIYLERGYRPREIPRLILEKNLFGLDIDGRAVQLASFALLMKARADDRTIFSADHPVTLNVVEIIETDFNVNEAVQTLTKGKSVAIEQMAMPFAAKPTQGELPLGSPGSLSPGELKDFIEMFHKAKTYGSLLTFKDDIRPKIAGIQSVAQRFKRSGDIFEQMYGTRIFRLCQQAIILGKIFDCVIVNPPYMGNKGMNSTLKDFVKANFPLGKSDLFAAFIERGLKFTAEGRYLSMVTMHSWMFLSSFEDLRKELLTSNSLTTLGHLGARAFSAISGEVVQTVAFTVRQGLKLADYKGSFQKLTEGDEEEKQERLRSKSYEEFYVKESDFSAIPGAPIAYWVSERMRQIFQQCHLFEEDTISDGQNKTSDNARFVRYVWEVSNVKVGPKLKWRLYAKGGDFRKWYGNLWHLIDWSDEARTHYRKDHSCRLVPEYLWYREGVTWTLLTSAKQSFRLLPEEATFDMTGSSIFLKDHFPPELALGFLNSCISHYLLKLFNPTLALQIRDVRNLPICLAFPSCDALPVRDMIFLSRQDWEDVETSWGFRSLPLVNDLLKEESLCQSYKRYEATCLDRIRRMQSLETSNNRLFIQAYGLESELSPEVPESEITLHRPDREEDIKAFLSYFTGCALGRYSLDEPGLIYANAANIGFDPSRYKKFPADADGVVPVLDYPWFLDDLATRFQEFLIACWGADTLEENMQFVAESLGPKRGETPEETIRRYFCDDFYKNHIKMYKKRPIYWLFSSGKENAFQALVYLHRYNEQTLSKMRTDYVLPLQGKMATEEKRLDAQIDGAATPAEKNRYKKELEKLKKKQSELKTFDELLHHYADKRISLDLDDGVKVNYGKFGALLADVRQITGGSEEE